MVPPASDFKKIKAKVGKRAPVKANVTDTSFRSTSLHVSHQSRVVDAGVSSGSGSSTVWTASQLGHWQRQLHHPTLSVKSAAIQSLRHWIRTVQNGRATISSDQPPLESVAPQLLLAIAPVVCTDVDVEVRRLAATALMELVQAARGTTVHSSDLPQPLWLIVPFVPYLTALIATALNALDESQSWDGATLVPWLVGEIVSYQASQAVGDDTVWRACRHHFIPPLTRLLSDRTMASSTSSAVTIVATSEGGSRNQSKSKKRKRSAAASRGGTTTAAAAPEVKSPKQAALVAIHSLLVAAVSTSRGQPMYKVPRPHVVVRYDNQTQRHVSLVLARMASRPPTVPIYSLDDMPIWSSLVESDLKVPLPQLTQATPANPSHVALAPTVALELLTKLRDSLVEATLQFRQQEVSSAQYIIMCAVSIRLVLDVNFQTDMTSDMSKRLQKLCLHIGSTICESFPLTAPRRRVSQMATTEETKDDSNAHLCETLLCLSRTLQSLWLSRSDQKSTVAAAAVKQMDAWVQTVVSHVQSALEDDVAAAAEGLAAHTGDTELEMDPTSPTTSQPLVSVLDQLLTLLGPGDDGTASFLDGAKRKDRFESWACLMDLFGTVFFPTETVLTASVAISETGRAAALLGCHLLLKEMSFREGQLEGSDVPLNPNVRESFVRDVLFGLPCYLIHWRGEYAMESCVCVSALQTLVRQGVALAPDRKNPVFDPSRLGRLLEPLFSCTSGLSGAAAKVSIFEQYPEEFQRQVLGLVTMLALPTVATVKSLADICTRCRTASKATQMPTVTPSVASFITQCIHSLRKLIPMPVYIGFLIDGTGVMSLAGSCMGLGDMNRASLQIDQGVRDASSCLVQCGTCRVLPMLEALLTTLLTRPTDATTPKVSSLLRARVALSMLAMFSWDLKQDGIDDASLFDLVSDDFQKLVLDEIGWTLSHGVILAELDTSIVLHRWIQPIMSLFASERHIMSLVFCDVVSGLDVLAESSQVQVLDVWSVVLKSTTFDLPKREDCSAMIANVKSLQSLSRDGPLDRHTGRLLAELELKSERNGWHRVAVGA